MRGLLGFILLVCAGMAHASVTAAWKLAIDARIPRHEIDGRVRTYVVRSEGIARCHLNRAGESVNVNPQDLTPSKQAFIEGRNTPAPPPCTPPPGV